MKMPDHVAFRLLEKYGIPIASFELVHSPTEAAKAASKLGWPAVLKVDGNIAHKTAIGCVSIVYNTAEAEREYDKILDSASMKTDQINGVIVQEFVRGKELAVGAKIDPQFGHVIMFGSGGTAIEILKDVTFRLLPLSKIDVQTMIIETKAWTIIPELQIQERFKDVVRVILAAGRLVLENPISELDINPLFINKDRVIAADVRIIKRP
jgi:acetyl-CoA synthetase (ADP-forming)